MSALRLFTAFLITCALMLAQSGADRRARIDIQQMNVDAVVNPNTQSLQARATIQFTPLDSDIQNVTFELNEALRVSQATDEKDQPLNVSRGPEFTIRVAYPQSLVKGQLTTVKITYDGRFSGQEESPVFGIRFAAIHNDFSYLLYPARWFPVNGYTSDRYLSEFNITVPTGFRVTGGGLETKSAGNGGDVWNVKFTQAGFGGSLGIVKGEPLRVQSQGANTALYFRQSVSQAKPYGEEIGKILSYFAGIFGTPPTSSLTVIETEKGAPGGYSGPGILFLAPGTIGNQVNSRGLANQIARQWWGQMVSASSRNHIWLTNGMARYAELLYLEHLGGPSVLEVELKDTFTEALTVDNPPLIQSARLEDYSPEFWALTGGKGAAVYSMLKLILGDDNYQKSIQQFLSSFAWKSVSTEDLRQVTQKVSGQDTGYFFIEWIESNGAPEFKLEYTVFRTQKGFRAVGRVAQDLDTFRMPVELKIETEGNPETKIVEVVGTASEFAIDTFGKPVRLLLDPSHKVLRWSPAIRVAVAIRRGEQFAEINDFPEALKEYQKALDVSRNSSLANYRIAEVFFLQNNYQTAANSFRDALGGDLEPRWIEVWSRIMLGKIFDVTGQRERAVNEYNLALRTKDDTQGAQEEAAKYLKEPYSRPISRD